VLDELRATYGPMVGLGAGPMRLAVVGDPDALRELFGMSTDSFRWGHRFNPLELVVGPRSLIVSDGAEWERRRAAMRVGFGRRRLNGWIDAIVACTDDHVDRLVDRIDGGPASVDLYPVGRALSQEVVVRALFGAQLADRSSEIAGLFQRAQDYLESPAYRQIPHPLPFGRRARVRADLERLRAIVDAQIARMRVAPTGDPLDVLEALVVDGSLDDAEIRDQVVSLMGAGLDTTSASLAWILCCTTLTGPELWGQLRDEADRVLTGDGPFDDTHLARLDLASRVVRETLRLHPPGSFAPRMAHVDVTIGGYRVPQGTLVLWSAHLAGRDPSAWHDPLSFDPDRFVDPTPEQKELADMAWVPFGKGARNCIGFALAQMELTLGLARLAQRLDVETLSDRAPRAIGMVVNRPEGGATMRVAAR